MAKTKTADKPTSDTHLLHFLQEEVDRIVKSTRMTWVVGLMLTVLVGCYMTSIVYVWRGILEPMTAARMVTQKVEDSLPGLLADTERALKAQAYPLANGLRDRILSAMPQQRKRAEELIDLTHEQFLPLLREELRTSIQLHVAEHADEFAITYAKEHKDEAFARAFIDSLVADVTASLDAKLKEAGQQDLSVVHADSLAALRAINADLIRLAELDPAAMTRSDQLQRRLIVSWARALEEAIRVHREGPYPAAP